jgi:NADPH:quinone reductase-like Zn-dependent oxidoreductase
MKAVRYSRFGGPEVLQIVDLPDPHVGPGQIRVAVHAVGVNPTDWKLRKGLMGGELPQTTGREVAGVVDEVGEGVTDVAVGDRVFGFSADGEGAADWRCSPTTRRSRRRLASPRPPDCPSPSRRPRAPWTRSAPGPGARCSSAAPPAGSAAPPSSSPRRGARVIGTASPANHDYLRSLGAEPVVYGEGLVERVRALAPDDVDAALDVAGSGVLPELIELAGGPERVVTITDFGWRAGAWGDVQQRGTPAVRSTRSPRSAS